MEKKVFETIEKHGLVQPGGTIITGLSGGADSVALLHVLHRLKERLGFSLYAIHVNHMIRGTEAQRDADFVTDLCKKLGVKLYVAEKNCPAYAAVNKLGLEESARVLRYEAFREAASYYDNAKIAVAHNADDNGETMLMRLFRGSSPYGLRGMDIVSGNIIRPLLDCTREEIETYLDLNHLPFVTDSTNMDTAYTRNRIRNRLIPYLKTEYNPNIMASLSRLSNSLKNDADYFQQIVGAAFSKYVKTGPDWVIISKEAFQSEHDAILRRLLRLCVKNIAGSDRDFDNVHMNMVLELVHLKSGKKVSLANGLAATNTFGDLAIYKTVFPDLTETPLIPGKHLILTSGEILSLSPEKLEAKENCSNTCTGIFRYDRMTEDIVVRKRRSGDVLRLPSGKCVKLKNYLIERKIPVFLRDRIDVVASGGEVVAILSGVNYFVNEDTACGEKFYLQLWRKNYG